LRCTIRIFARSKGNLKGCIVERLPDALRSTGLPAQHVRRHGPIAGSVATIACTTTRCRLLSVYRCTAGKLQNLLEAPMGGYDVFLSHRSNDKSEVEAIAKRLEIEAELRPFLDSWHLVPGTDVQEGLEQALRDSASFAVFIGKDGVIGWVETEVRAMIEARAKEKTLRIIPVFLQGAAIDALDQLPPPLRRFLAVDFRNGPSSDESFERLVAGITGKPPRRTQIGALSESSLFLKMGTQDIFHKELGLDVPKAFIDTALTIDTLSRRINARIPDSNIDAIRQKLLKARASVYDIKYAQRGKDEDERYLDFVGWETSLRELLLRYANKPISEIDAINVGIGNGNECPIIYGEFRSLVGVDVSPQSLRRAHVALSFLTPLLLDAENLIAVANKSFDLYLSLRTYQSSFFDVERAATEAARVLRVGGVAIISIPNAYITGHSVAKGLQVDGGRALDLNKPWEVVDRVRREFTALDFDCSVHSGSTEIFVVARQ
jgi:SAM-dependent methyltransferase